MREAINNKVNWVQNDLNYYSRSTNTFTVTPDVVVVRYNFRLDTSALSILSLDDIPASRILFFTDLGWRSDGNDFITNIVADGNIT